MRIGMATVVIEPGWSFRLMAIGTQLAGAAIIWWLADRVSETGLTSGTLIIYGTFHVLALGVAILDGGESLAVAEFGGAFALVPAFAATLVLLVAGMTGPPSLQLRPGAELRSTLDLALVPVAAWGITRAFVSQSPIPQEMVAAAASLFVTLGLVAWCVSHRRGLRVGPLLLSPLPAIVGGLFAFGGMALAPGGLDALLAPSPFHGDVTATVVVEAAEPGPDDAEILADRLEALEIDATVRGSGGRVELDLRGVVGVPEVLDAVLPRRFLSLHEVVEEGDTRRPAAVLQACHYPDRPADCEPYPILEAQLSSTDISRADVRLGEYGNTFVLVSFTPDGGQRFGDMTAAMVGRRLAIAIDGEVMSVPVVRQAIRGGRAHIEVSHPKSVAREAEALAAAMRSRPLQGAWTLAEIKAP
jgi:hypothetical protein